MRYIAKASGRVLEVSFGAMIECGDMSCTEYTGEVPAGYDSLFDWFTQEGEHLYRWKIVEGNLTKIQGAKEPAMPVPFGLYKIWQNPTPEAEFTPQTVDLDMEGYSGVFVYFRGVATGAGRYVSEVIPVGQEAYIHCHALNGDVRQRLVRPTENGIEFETGYKGETEGNQFAVPIEIYAFSGLVDKTKGDVHAICGTFLCGEVVAGQ